MLEQSAGETTWNNIILDTASLCTQSSRHHSIVMRPKVISSDPEKNHRKVVESLQNWRTDWKPDFDMQTIAIPNLWPMRRNLAWKFLVNWGKTCCWLGKIGVCEHHNVKRWCLFSSDCANVAYHHSHTKKTWNRSRWVNMWVFQELQNVALLLVPAEMDVSKATRPGSPSCRSEQAASNHCGIDANLKSPKLSYSACLGKACDCRINTLETSISWKYLETSISCDNKANSPDFLLHPFAMPFSHASKFSNAACPQVESRPGSRQ